MTVLQLVEGDSAARITAVREGLSFESFATLRDALDVSTDELSIPTPAQMR